MTDRPLEDLANVDAAMTTAGSPGLQRFGGVISEELLTKLRGQRGMKVYREMMTDPIISAVVLAIKLSIREAEWSVEPFDPTVPEHVERAQFVWSVLNDLDVTFDDWLSEKLDMVGYGFDVSELVYKVRQGYQQPIPIGMNQDGTTQRPPPTSNHTDGLIGIHRAFSYSQESVVQWLFDDDGDDATEQLLGVEQQAPPKWRSVKVPMLKLLHFRTEVSRGNPEGRSLIRSAYRPWWFMRRMEETEAIGIERDLAGLPKVTAPATVVQAALSGNGSPAEVAAGQSLIKMLEDVRKDKRQGVMIASDPWKSRDGQISQIQQYDFELVSAGGSGRVDVGGAITRKQAQMAMSVMADFLLLGHEQVGSFALADSKTHMFAFAVHALAESVAAVVNGQLIPRLFVINGFPTDEMPKLTVGDIETPDLAPIAQLIVAAANAGMMLFPDIALENRLRQFMGLPPIDETQRAVQEAEDAAAAEAELELARERMASISGSDV